MMRSVVFVLAGFLYPALPAFAGDRVAGDPVAGDPVAGDPVAGGDMALRLCSGCRAVVPGEASPVAQASPFSGFAAKWPLDYLSEALAEGIVTDHTGVEMPEFRFEPDEIDDLIAFLATIRPATIRPATIRNEK
ncbi:MAG: cytochrome C [Alphaproteobacteria bacterium]